MLIERGVKKSYTRGFKSFSAPEVERHTKQDEEYDDLETECWARMRTWLRRSTRSINAEKKGDGRLRIDLPEEDAPYSDQLQLELTERDHFVTPDGKIKLQPKKDYIKQNGESPDFAEAVIIGSRMVWIAQEKFKAVISDEDYKAHIEQYPVG